MAYILFKENKTIIKTDLREEEYETSYLYQSYINEFLNNKTTKNLWLLVNEPMTILKDLRTEAYTKMGFLACFRAALFFYGIEQHIGYTFKDLSERRDKSLMLNRGEMPCQ